jgi:hypothetical protein
MKRILLLVFPFLLIGCYTYQVYRLEPSETENTFTEQGRPYSYQRIDSVIVSVGFDTYLENEYIFDVTVDNQSNKLLTFDPAQAYLFCYASDTSLLEKKIFFAIDPENRIDSIQYSILTEQKRARRNTIFSIVLAAAYITTEVAAVNSDISYETMEAIRATHTISQAILDESRADALNKADYLYFTQDYWHCNAFRKTMIQADTFNTGKIHFKVPYSPLYKVYIPVDGQIYRFNFNGISEKK